MWNFAATEVTSDLERQNKVACQFDIRTPKNIFIAALADIGFKKYGWKIAQSATQRIVQYLYERGGDLYYKRTNLENLLTEAVLKGNETISEFIAQNNLRENFETSLLAALITNQESVIVQIGEGIILVREISKEWDVVFYPHPNSSKNNSLQSITLKGSIADIALISGGIVPVVFDYQQKILDMSLFNSFVDSLVLEQSNVTSTRISQELNSFLKKQILPSSTNNDISLILATSGSYKTLECLGKKISRGGEGEIFLLKNNPNVVAKIYSKEVPEQKLEDMIKMRESEFELSKVCAWPKAFVLDTKTRTRKGFIMDRVESQNHIHKLYSIKDRQKYFPKANFQFLVHVAYNLVCAFDEIHQAGIIIGDVNHSNILVQDNGTVMFIDCDSFQITTYNHTYFCNVGTVEYTPPELQKVTLRNVQRTKNHDLFGLAVLIFQLLFLGRHPFAGCYLGKGEPPTMEQAITEYRFAYSHRRSTYEYDIPPGIFPLETMGAEISELFERAFDHKKDRPEAAIWIRTLQVFQQRLVKCQKNDWHHYFDELVACPWCRIEDKMPFYIFGPVASKNKPETFSSFAASMPPPAASMPPPAAPTTSSSTLIDLLIYLKGSLLLRILRTLFIIVSLFLGFILFLGLLVLLEDTKSTRSGFGQIVSVLGVFVFVHMMFHIVPLRIIIVGIWLSWLGVFVVRIL